jgi:hypothetical protein
MGSDVFYEDDIDDIDDIVRKFTDYGLVVVPGHLSKDQVDRATEECDVLFHHTPQWAHHEDYSLGQSVRMERAEVEQARFPTLLSALDLPVLETIVDRIFGPHYIFSRTIYAILDVVGSRTHVQQLHYDKMRHLKAFVYLSDVGPRSGAFHCVPGSHRLTQQIEERNRREHVVPSDDDARRLPPELADDIVPILGDAGTLILFDSDIAHHAGVVQEGTRLAIRSLSFGAYRSEPWYQKDGTVKLPST